AFAAVGVTCPQSLLDELAGMPAPNIVAIFNERYGHNLDITAVAEDKERRTAEKLKTVGPIQSVVDLVYRYHGTLPMAVASGGRLAGVETSLRAIGLFDYFDAILTADDATQPKPAPDIFLAAAERLGVASEDCEVFEDGEMGLIGARKAGMVATDIRPYL
ncbi:MAG: HAD-IA family hydrolase, partial [Anaerolineae bacterium]|nr:HAD-IA family hydrolase [Anaerolineae bacterium]